MLKVIRKKSAIKEVIKDYKKNNKSIGLVPTMGALHAGHRSLIELSEKHYDITVVTIFVNPAQFNNPEDLKNYPRNEGKDLALLRKTGCSVVFIPGVGEIYSNTPRLRLDFGNLETIMEGKFRPGHFNGVGVVVAKLLGIIEPDGAFFGQKDLQQFRIISTLVKDLNIPVKLHMAPIVRETNGLALSSRNERLSQEQKELAVNLNKSLVNATIHINNGGAIKKILKHAKEQIEDIKGIDLEYFEIVSFETLENISEVNRGDRLALCLAAYIGGVRLIDNTVIEL